MRTVAPSTRLRSAIKPSAKCFSDDKPTTVPAALGSRLFSTLMRCASLSAATGSSSLGTHHTRAARALPSAVAGSGSSASGPSRVKRSTAKPGVAPTSVAVPTQAVCR